MRIPMWAQNLVLQVAIDEGRDDLPELTWRKRHKQRLTAGMKAFIARDPDRARRWAKHTVAEGSSGRTFKPYSLFKPDRVHVTAGSDRKDQKLVLLHELAHWLLPAGEHHGADFWDKAWELYRRYKVPIRYAKAREGNYRKGAIAAYRRSR